MVVKDEVIINKGCLIGIYGSIKNTEHLSIAQYVLYSGNGSSLDGSSLKCSSR